MKIHKHVRKVKINEEVGVKYMQAWEEKYYAKEEGIEIGREKGEKEILRKLIEKKLEKGKNNSQIAEDLEMGVVEVEKIIMQMKEGSE